MNNPAPSKAIIKGKSMEEKYLFRMGPQGQCNEACPIKPNISIGSAECIYKCGNCKEDGAGPVGDKIGVWIICNELNKHRMRQQK